MAVVTHRRLLRGPLTSVWIVAAAVAIVAVAALLVTVAFRVSTGAGQDFRVTVMAETLGGALPVLQGHQVVAEVSDEGLEAGSQPSTTTVTSRKTSVVRLTMTGAPWWNVNPSVRASYHEQVRSAQGDGTLVVSDWQTSIADADTGAGGASAALAGWRVDFNDAAPR